MHKKNVLFLCAALAAPAEEKNTNPSCLVHISPAKIGLKVKMLDFSKMLCYFKDSYWELP